MTFKCCLCTHDIIPSLTSCQNIELWSKISWMWIQESRILDVRSEREVSFASTCVFLYHVTTLISAVRAYIYHYYQSGLATWLENSFALSWAFSRDERCDKACLVQTHMSCMGWSVVCVVDQLAMNLGIAQQQIYSVPLSFQYQKRREMMLSLQKGNVMSTNDDSDWSQYNLPFLWRHAAHSQLHRENHSLSPPQRSTNDKAT